MAELKYGKQRTRLCLINLHPFLAREYSSGVPRAVRAHDTLRVSRGRREREDTQGTVASMHKDIRSFSWYSRRGKQSFPEPFRDKVIRRFGNSATQPAAAMSREACSTSLWRCLDSRRVANPLKRDFSTPFREFVSVFYFYTIPLHQHTSTCRDTRKWCPSPFLLFTRVCIRIRQNNFTSLCSPSDTHPRNDRGAESHPSAVLSRHCPQGCILHV